MPEPRRVIIAKDPEGKTVVVGPVGSQHAVAALRAMLMRHGWTPGTEATCKSRAEWIREQVAPAYAEAARHRAEAHGGSGCNCPPGPPAEGTAPVRTVTIPGSEQHNGMHSIRVTLSWTCPQCGGPRGEPFETVSYDGSRRLGCDGWRNPCGHVDLYPAVRQEAAATEARDQQQAELKAETRPCEVPRSCPNGPAPHAFCPVRDDPLPHSCSRQPWEMTVVPAVLAATDEEAPDGQ